jgi:hypothetical protein
MSKSHLGRITGAIVVLAASAAFALASRPSAPIELPPVPVAAPVLSPPAPPPPPEAPAAPRIVVPTMHIYGHVSKADLRRADCGPWQLLAQGPATARVRRCAGAVR